MGACNVERVHNVHGIPKWEEEGKMDGAGMSLQMESPAKAGEKKGISGSTIKIVAIVAMLIDHIAAVVLTRQIMAEGYADAIMGGQSSLTSWMAENGSLFMINTVMRAIGRLGFPIFCFLLVEGFGRSRNIRKYALRLGLFALISEIPFDLALTGRWWYTGYQNVYFTLLLGLLALCGYGFFVKYEKREGMDCTEVEIDEFCKELPRYKRPKEIIFHEIPRNATGKIEKPKLRKMYGADQLVAQENRG